LATPYLPLYTRDWRSDPKLRASSFAARGLWVEMMALMHEAVPYGFLGIGERRLTENDLAVIAQQCGALGGAPVVKKLLAELRENGVYSVADDGTIYSRRMVRDEEKREQNRLNGKKGGHPSLKPSVNPTDNPPPVNPPGGVGSDKPVYAHALGWVGYGLAPTQSSALEAMPRERALGTWFVWAGAKSGAIPAHREPFAERDALNWLEIAEALLGAHDLAEIQRRALRMFDLAQVRGPERWRIVTHWNSFGVTATPEAPPAASSTRSRYAQLRDAKGAA
jgi:hypothetical protein